jgi:hypothetical protein
LRPNSAAFPSATAINTQAMSCCNLPNFCLRVPVHRFGPNCAWQDIIPPYVLVTVLVQSDQRLVTTKRCPEGKQQFSSGRGTN